MKRTVACVVGLLFAGALVFAGGNKEQGGKKTVVNVASIMAAGTPSDLGMHKFKEEFEKATNGRYEVLIHPGSAMGDEQQTFEMVEDGSVEMGVLGTLDISVNYPKYFCMEVPYIFRNVDQMWKYWAGPGKELNDLIEKERGVRITGIVLRGARYLTANKPIRNMADLKGLNMRVPAQQVMHDFWSAFGAVPTSVAFNEVYMALKTGAVEAQENPPESIDAMKFYEVQKYIMTTRHIFAANRFLLSMKWYNTLSDEDKKAFDSSIKTAVDYANSLSKNLDDELISQLAAKGMTVVDIDTSDLVKTAQTVIEQYARKEWVPGLYERMKDL
jgi:tripartite ATP-independent transporter DctP family solute receptor